MTEPWTSFLTRRLPIALVILALVAELGAWALRDAPRARHPLDRLVLGLDDGPFEADFVLLGDSVTQDVADTYRLAPNGALANLTTNQASGIAGSYLLLRRYLAENPAPRHVAVVATPEFMGFVPDGATAETYLASVFRRSGEPDILSRFEVDADSGNWTPAILDIDATVLDPLIGVAAATPSPVTGGETDPTLVESVEGPGGNAVGAASIQARVARPPMASAGAAPALAALCDLAREVGASLHVAWAPMPETVWRTWREANILAEWRARLAAGACADARFHDFNTAMAYPDHGFRDSDHLRRPGWTARFGRDLTTWIAARRAE